MIINIRYLQNKNVNLERFEDYNCAGDKINSGEDNRNI